MVLLYEGIDMEAALRRFEAREAEAEAAPLVPCDDCGLMCDPADVECIDGRRLCDKCADSFYAEEAFARYGQAYIAESVKRHVKRPLAPDNNPEMFYLWHFFGLTKEVQARYLKGLYEMEKATRAATYNPDDEQVFCVCSDDWREFVQSRLDGDKN